MNEVSVQRVSPERVISAVPTQLNQEQIEDATARFATDFRHRRRGMPKTPITNIIFGTMTLGYHGYGARVHDAATADAMLDTFKKFGHDQIDTCAQYGDGSCEQMLGDVCAAERFDIATRIHW